jgi:hypothetical protein
VGALIDRWWRCVSVMVLLSLGGVAVFVGSKPAARSVSFTLGFALALAAGVAAATVAAGAAVVAADVAVEAAVAVPAADATAGV